MDDLLRSAVVKKVLLKVVIKPFLVSLVPILLIMLTFVFVKLGISSGGNLFASLLLEGDVVGFFLIAPIFILCLHILIFKMLVKNFVGKGFDSFRIDKFGRQCDFYRFVFGKRMGIVPMGNSHLVGDWMPLAGRQKVTLILILFVVFFVLGGSLL